MGFRLGAYLKRQFTEIFGPFKWIKSEEAGHDVGEKEALRLWQEEGHDRDFNDAHAHEFEEPGDEQNE